MCILLYKAPNSNLVWFGQDYYSDSISSDTDESRGWIGSEDRTIQKILCGY